MHLRINHFIQAVLCFVISALSLGLASCSISDSSGSISDSIQGSSQSISDSSKSIGDSSTSDSSKSISDSSTSDKDTKYKNEVADYTMAYVKSSPAQVDFAGFYKGLSDIAAKRGISNWDQDPLTYEGIGKGLKKAGVKGIAYETYKKNFANSNVGKMLTIDKGYGME